MVRVLVTGDRNWRNARVVRDRLFEVAWVDLRDPVEPEELVLIEGEAMGADIISAVVVELIMEDGTEFQSDPRWVAIERYPALWNEHGRRAGPIRNQQMLDSGIDYVVGFHDNIDTSRGTRDMLRRCARAGIPGRLFTQTGEVTDWRERVGN